MQLYKIQFVAAINFQYSNLVLDCRAVASTKQSEALASVICFRGFLNAGVKNTVNTCEENLTVDSIASVINVLWLRPLIVAPYSLSTDCLVN